MLLQCWGIYLDWKFQNFQHQRASQLLRGIRQICYFYLSLWVFDPHDWKSVVCECCAAGAEVAFHCSSTSQSSLYFVAHFCLLHSLGSVLQPSLIFSFSRMLELDLRCPLLLQSTNQKVWRHVFPTQNTNYESIKTSSLPLSFPSQRWQTGKEKQW